jgi:hypothetical protein
LDRTIRAFEEVPQVPTRRAVFVVLGALLVAGCATVEHAERPAGPFQVALLATADTRGELEPCG